MRVYREMHIKITYPVSSLLLIHIHLSWCATCLCVKENREIRENEGPGEKKEKDVSLDFSVLVPGGVTMCTQQCTSDGNSTWGCHH